jgi:hypothetical protein
VIDRLRHGLRLFRARFGAPSALVASGGVAANAAIRAALMTLAGEDGVSLVVPPAALCTDNGAMIAWAGAERLAYGLCDRLDAAPRARWPLAQVGKPGGIREEEGAGPTAPAVPEAGETAAPPKMAKAESETQAAPPLTLGDGEPVVSEGATDSRPIDGAPVPAQPDGAAVSAQTAGEPATAPDAQPPAAA